MTSGELAAKLIGRTKQATKCPHCGKPLQQTRQSPILELLLVLVFCMVPTFVLASEVDGDEFAKASSGAILAGIVLGVYRVFKGVGSKRTPQGDDDGND